MTDEELQQAMLEGKEAERLLSSAAFLKAVEQVKADLTKEWIVADVPDPTIHAQAKALDRVVRRLHSILDVGRAAEKTVETNRRNRK